MSLLLTALKESTFETSRFALTPPRTCFIIQEDGMSNVYVRMIAMCQGLLLVSQITITCSVTGRRWRNTVGRNGRDQICRTQVCIDSSIVGTNNLISTLEYGHLARSCSSASVDLAICITLII